MKLGAHFPQPAPYVPSEEFAIRITGIGGTRLVTVARIIADAAHLARLRVRTLVQTVFGPDATYAWRLHPPPLHQLGRRRKIALDRWATPLFVTLRGGRRLRGTAFDPFGRFAVRRVERRLAGEYTTVVEEVVAGLHGGSPRARGRDCGAASQRAWLRTRQAGHDRSLRRASPRAAGRVRDDDCGGRRMTTAQGVLAGRVALVTGGASGIGRATAELFAEQGAAVVVADVNEAGEETVAAVTEAGGQATFVRGDVSVETDVEAMVEVAESVYGGLDAAFNNAGIGVPLEPFEELDSDRWARVLAVNLGGVCLCMKHELAVMVPRGRGTIVNTSSVAGLVGTPQSAPYTAAKHGVVGLTRTAALEHGRNGIRVNAIAPGFTRTPMVKELFENPSSEIEQLLALSPLGRVAEPSEIAEAALWLTSPASSFVTGHVLVVDGGFTAQ